MKVKTSYWDVLLKLKSIYKTVVLAQQTIVIKKDLQILVSENTVLSDDALLLIRFNANKKNNKEHFEIEFSSTISKKTKKIFELYLPYIIVNKDVETPFTLVHIAQTIDGKIATPTGKSKWIGNKQNLIHAHRTRALVDAILIGANTFKLDNPKLDVRLVTGENPVKVILSNSELSLDCLSLGKTLLFSNRNLSYDILPHDTELIFVDKQEKTMCTKAILKILKAKGIHSLLVEGGSETIRKFIEDQTLDRIEFHIAPMIFGSGKSGISLREIDNLEEGIVLKNPISYKTGNAIMIVANL